MKILWLVATLAPTVTSARLVDWEADGAIAELTEPAVRNTELLNAALASLQPGDILYISNKTFWLAGGVKLSNARAVTIQIDGSLKFLPGREGWPLKYGAACNDGTPDQPVRKHTCVQEAFYVANVTGLKFTSNGTGTLNGNGNSWWGYLSYLRYAEDRPRLLHIRNSTDILVEHVNFVNSAYWTFTANDVARLEIRQCTIDNRRNGDDAHSLENLGAFNTDGFDVSGRDIHIHHSSVWNQDDCFTIQPSDSTFTNTDCTENVLVEHVNASGLGLTIGAVDATPGHNCVRNVTFRDAHMHHTFKGIYIKSHYSDNPNASGEITNILYEDVVMEAPEQVPIWIGPSQEADSKNACSLFWPEMPFSSCPPPPLNILIANITLRNILVKNSKQSPGVVLGNAQRPMKNITFDNVIFENPGKSPWGDAFYKCTGVEGRAVGGTSPVPPCFEVQKDLVLFG